LAQKLKRRIILRHLRFELRYTIAYYVALKKVRELIRQDFVKAFEKVDAIVSPT